MGNLRTLRLPLLADVASGVPHPRLFWKAQKFKQVSGMSLRPYLNRKRYYWNQNDSGKVLEPFRGACLIRAPAQENQRVSAGGQSCARFEKPSSFIVTSSLNSQS